MHVLLGFQFEMSEKHWFLLYYTEEFFLILPVICIPGFLARQQQIIKVNSSFHSNSLGIGIRAITMDSGFSWLLLSLQGTFLTLSYDFLFFFDHRHWSVNFTIIIIYNFPIRFYLYLFFSWRGRKKIEKS